MPGSPVSSSSSAPSRPNNVAAGVDTLSAAYDLIDKSYAEPTNPTAVVAAGTRGLWSALAQRGLLTADIDTSPAAAARETREEFARRYVRLAARHATKVDPASLAHAAIRASAQELNDCHTSFLTPAQLQEQIRRLRGEASFAGVGVVVRRASESEPVTLVEVFESGPAGKAGLRRGDRLIAVDGVDLSGLSIEEVVRRVRGDEGARVLLRIARGTTGETFDVGLDRARVQAPVASARMLAGSVGFLHIYAFPASLPAQLDQLTGDLVRRGARALIVDVRDNAGGQLEVVAQVSSRFVARGALFQELPRNGERQIRQADGSATVTNVPIAVLANKGTSSGGEIFASALKENGSARLVGKQTAGCVSVGQMHPLPDGSGLELSVSRILSGRGEPLNGVGVRPDHDIELTADDLAFDRDPQLAFALGLLSGR